MNNQELDRIIEKGFSSDPGFSLSVDFAKRLTLKVIGREQWKNDLREYFLLSSVIVALLLIVAGFYYFVNQDFVLKAFDFLSTNLIPVISVLILVNFIFFADKVILRQLFRRWN
jgi:hypothetical protein